EPLDAAEHGGSVSTRRRPVVIAGDTDLDALFKRLHLANARRVWRQLVERAERESWSYRDFLALLATEEIAHRQQTRLARLTGRAHFPFLKTIDDFNFTYQSSLRLHMLGSALAPDFVTEGRSLILAGKSGRGKTHLAIAVAYRAIQNGFDAFFTTAAALIDDLSAAFRAGELANALPTYTHPAVLVVDEVGYLTYGTDAANMLFHVVNERHRRHRPLIFTTNKSLKAWGRVLHDEDLAQGIIDRVLERGRLLRLDGPSVRTLHVNLDEAMKEDSDQSVDLVRISGKPRSEFPEPTFGRPSIGRMFEKVRTHVRVRRCGRSAIGSVDRVHQVRPRNGDAAPPGFQHRLWCAIRVDDGRRLRDGEASKDPGAQAMDDPELRRCSCVSCEPVHRADPVAREIVGSALDLP